MLKSLNLKTKIFFLVSPVVVVSFLTVAWIVSSWSIKMAQSDAYKLALEMAEKYKSEIKSELQGARVTSETLATVFGTLKLHGLTDRDMMNDILKNALAQKEYITAFCVAYDPNALDGLDFMYAGKEPLYDETGRYAPYWNKIEGGISVMPLYNIDSADWYAVPKKTKREYITDPYPFNVRGQTVILASLIFPIVYEDEFIGIVASDIILDKLQEMVSDAGVHNVRGRTGIFSNSGAIVADPEKKYLGRDLGEMLAHEMLLADHSLAGSAVRYVRDYVEKNPSDSTSATFLDNLEAYAKNPVSVSLDLSLMSQGLAMELLKADGDRLGYALKAKDSVKNGTIYKYRDKYFYTIYMPIKFSEDTRPWSVGVRVPIYDILKDANGLRNYVLGLSIISVFLIACVLYLIARSVTKPVLLLAKAAKSLGDGNFDVEVPDIRGNDEIGILARAFNVMAEKIDDLVKKSQNYTKTLEEKNDNLNRLNEQLLAAKDESERSNRAKSNFLSHMSHEMRTPLTAVIGMTTVGKSAADIEKKDYAFEKIESASTHLLGVVNDILDMSKIEAGKLELSPAEFDFEKMLQKVVNVVNFRIEEKQQVFHMSIDGDIPARLVGDDQRLTQVITNLVANAVKFTPENGSIRLDTHFMGEREGLCTVGFEISDTGIGISLEQQERLFQCFEQADRSTSRKFGGTGLGLAISKCIVEMMGGHIGIESELGKGATFYFTVRLGRGNPANSELSDAKAIPKDTHILVVDEDPDAMRCFEEAERRLGVSYDTVYGGGEAAVMIERHTPYDICFIDWEMRGMSGFDLVETIKDKSAKTSIVAMLSSSDWNTLGDELKSAGVTSFLTKPLFSSDIVACIYECLGCGGSTKDKTPTDRKNIFQKCRILLAEDVEINREIVIDLLETTGLAIDCAENGEEALHMFEENPERYDAILMDLQMPVMDGLEATRHIRALDNAKAKKIPIIAMTANVFREDIEECLNAGMQDHVGKPLDLDVLIEKLHKYLPRDD